MQSVLVFLSNRPTLCSICHCWLDHCFMSFSLMGTFLSHSTPVSCFHFIQASLTRLLMSLSAPPFESNIDPKYLNVVTVFSLSSPGCNISTTNLAACVCVCAKFDQFLPVRSHFDTKRPVNFFHIATFPSPTFGPLFAFHCPLFFTKNNNLECRDVLKTVTVTSDQKRFGPYTAHN